jgi:hypothetical protein
VRCVAGNVRSGQRVPSVLEERCKFAEGSFIEHVIDGALFIVEPRSYGSGATRTSAAAAPMLP